jgi:hypothetical protein
LRYLLIHHPEKSFYDFYVPGFVAIMGSVAYSVISPRSAILGDDGLLRFVRDLLIMGVPFMVGALAAVAMGAPGTHLEKRPVGTQLFLDGESLTLQQFVSYLLGYLSFLGLIMLGLAVAASLLRNPIEAW